VAGLPALSILFIHEEASSVFPGWSDLTVFLQSVCCQQHFTGMAVLLCQGCQSRCFLKSLTAPNQHAQFSSESFAQDGTDEDRDFFLLSCFPHKQHFFLSERLLLCTAKMFVGPGLWILTVTMMELSCHTGTLLLTESHPLHLSGFLPAAQKCPQQSISMVILES